ncbi:hypothetical protein [Psychrobacter sp. DM8]|uniref:hypothetical protein n=1 Tax=Psychrobacter sp. DM8 TaxID=3440636 RepID=UPI003F4FDBAA
MKNIRISVLVSALFLTTPFLVANSDANAENGEKIEDDASDQCGYYYQQALNHPLITRETAVTNDIKKAEEIVELRRFADEHIMNANIADFPMVDDTDSYDNAVQIQQLLAEGEFISQDTATQILRRLFSVYFLGEYLPKDDYQAITYLKKLVDYYSQVQPERAEYMVILVMSSLNEGADNISEANPMWAEDDPSDVFKMLIEAGSIEAKSMLIVEDYETSYPACITTMLPKLEALANRGSRIAIHKMAEIYSELNDENPARYHEKMSYWHHQAQEHPLEPFDLGRMI